MQKVMKAIGTMNWPNSPLALRLPLLTAPQRRETRDEFAVRPPAAACPFGAQLESRTPSHPRGRCGFPAAPVPQWRVTRCGPLRASFPRFLRVCRRGPVTQGRILRAVLEIVWPPSTKTNSDFSDAYANASAIFPNSFFFCNSMCARTDAPGAGHPSLRTH